MRKLGNRRPSAAMIVAVLALCMSVAGTAVAAGVFTSPEKKAIKKIAKKQANKRITARAGSLSVANAVTSNGPAAYANVSTAGTVVATQTRGVANTNITNPTAGHYCFKGLPAYKTAMATLSSGATPQNSHTSTGVPGPGSPCAGNQFEVVTTNATALANEPFTVWFGS
jgi:hypothetical protein